MLPSKSFLLALALALAMTLSAGCASVDRQAHADALAAAGHLQHERLQADAFVLTAYTRITRADQPLRVYLEGDGFAWVSRNQPSLDPTPRHPVGLMLAAQDPSPNVAYLARPCQYTPMADNPQCGSAWWTGKRFAPPVVASLNAALDQLRTRTPGQPLELVGYSGGGALAVLLAARRQDVAAIRNVAGNLDTEFVNALHQVSAMPESLNPITDAPRVANIPQRHFSGANDAIVPPRVAQRFVAATGTRCASTRTIPGLDHGGDWAQHWRTLLGNAPACRDGTSP
ncbi:hypothetical protein BRI6_2815 [plant metagenome]|uniref:Alpha/beta hydrolase n=1 Tax=plant metagenome TaxID=1297885 RepID=A0A484V136_9ZZZZ